MHKTTALVISLAAALALQAAQPPDPQMQAALAHISADSLRGNLSFLASDLLEGRATPSRGLDLAAEYIAAQFRRAGLEPAGDDGYFQTARMVAIEQTLDGSELTLQNGTQEARCGSGQLRALSDKALDLTAVPVFKTTMGELRSLKPEQVQGKALAVEFSYRGFRRIMKAVNALQPAVILDTGRMDLPESRLVDPADHRSDMPPWIGVRDEAGRSLLAAAPAGSSGLTVSVHLPAPARRELKLRNVIGVLRGSDPALKDSYELITAHYDHVGMKPDGDGDRIFNGANDDGSGTVSVIEIAGALATLPRHPRRSIVFMTFFGEERGGLGSLYYAAHPVFPLAKTIADVNLEQLGRTDANDGPQVGTATFTGFGFSDMPAVFQQAGEATGVKVYNPADGDSFFNRSDNASFADRGVPAHTICVAFEYPDYHGVGDEWQKIDYDNMAKVDRMIALGAVFLAENPQPPHWEAANPKVSQYLKAARDLGE